MMRASIVVAAILLFFSAFTAAQEEKPGAGDRFIVPDDLEVTTWAEAPQFFNPTNIDVDARGRIWVAEAVNYRGWVNKSEKDVRWHEKGDRIVILEDTDGDGKCDSSKVFVQDKDLVAPLGICVLGNRVVVSCSPSIFIYTDEDGDDKPDRKEIFLAGFGGFDHDHGVHAVVAGPDGRWYFNCGNSGPNFVTDRSGWTLWSGSIYIGGGAKDSDNRPALVSDDGRVWTGGLTMRVEPDGTGLEVIGHNFRNSFEVAVDSFGNVWQNDNDDNISCRTLWVMEGGNCGYLSADGSRSWQADQRPGQSVWTSHWHQEDPGVIPAGDNTGPGGPTGVVMYETGSLGPKYEGMLISCEAGRNVLWGYFPEPQGAGYKLERFNLLTSLAESTENYVWHELPQDKRKWFRPSDAVVGTDGALYVADWYDPIVGGHKIKEVRGYGRILRVVRKGTNPRPPKVDVSVTKGQVEALRSPAINIRRLGWLKLAAQGAAALPALRELLGDPNPRIRARALWLLGRIGGKGFEDVEKALKDPDPDIRITAYRICRRHGRNVLENAAVLADDPSIAVRREVCLSLRDVPLSLCKDLILKLAGSYDGKDRWYLEAWGSACDGKEESVFPALLAKYGGPAPEWSEQFAGLAWRLHPVAATVSFAARAGSAELPVAARRQAMDALAFIRTQGAVDAMAVLATDGPGDLRESAKWWIKFRATNDWRSFEISEKFGKKRDRTLLEAALKLQVKMLDFRTRMEDRIAAAKELCGTAEGGLQLVNLASRDRLPKEFYEIVSAAIFDNPDLSVRAIAGEFFQRPTADDRKLPPIPDLARMKGDAKRGKEVFFGKKAACGDCHVVAGKGTQIGPDLTEIRTKFDKEGMLNAVLNPSADIATGYETVQIETEDEEIFYGFIIGEGPTVTLKDNKGEIHMIPADEIARRRSVTLSMMPDNVGLGMEPQELVDIVTYLLVGEE